MANTNRSRESADTLGLLIVKHSRDLSPQGKAADAAGVPTCAADYCDVEDVFEPIESGETRQSVIGSLRAEAARFAQGRSEASQEVSDLLLHFADRVEQIDETVGELLARTRCEEGDRIEIRWPTWQEEIAPTVARLTELVAGDISLHTTNDLPEAIRKADGSLVAPLRCTEWPEEAVR